MQYKWIKQYYSSISSAIPFHISISRNDLYILFVLFDGTYYYMLKIDASTAQILGQTKRSHSFNDAVFYHSFAILNNGKILFPYDNQYAILLVDVSTNPP